MLNGVTIERDKSDQRYNDVLDVIEAMGNGIFGTYRNALVVLCESSPRFPETLARLRDPDSTPSPAAPPATEVGT